MMMTTMVAMTTMMMTKITMMTTMMIRTATETTMTSMATTTMTTTRMKTTMTTMSMENSRIINPYHGVSQLHLTMLVSRHSRLFRADMLMVQ